MPTLEQPLDPNDFIIVPAVYVLDEFDMTDDDGNVVARIDAKFIEKIVRRMAEREAKTGDLCPIVIGHTLDHPQGGDEVNGPPLVGYFRNWQQLPFFDSGKTAAAADAWIFKQDVERVKKFPRRSSEVWLSKYEIDPVSFLGATTPARDLGLLKLNRGGSFLYHIGVAGSLFDRPRRLARDPDPSPTNRESDMADEKDDKKIDDKKSDKPAADPAQSGSAKTVEGKLDALLSMMQSLVDKLAGAPAATPGADAGAAAPGASGEDAPLSDDELDQYLAQLEGGAGASDAGKSADAPAGDADEKSRKGDEPIKNSTGYPGGNDTMTHGSNMKRLARVEEENEILRVKLARMDVKDRLRRAVSEAGADLNPEDDKLVSELVSLPDEMRESMIVRLSRVKSKTADTGHASSANRDAVDGNAKRKVSNRDERAQVIKLAREKGLSYEVAANQLGFVIN